MKLKLPIFFHTDTTKTMDGLGIDHSFDQCEIREVIFYRIDAISPHYEGDNSYTEIFTSKDSFVCTYPIDYVEQLIEQAK